MNVGIFLLGAAILAIGLISLAKPDWMWSLTEMGNSMRGQVSERTDLWGIGNSIGGVIAVVFGLVVMVMSFGES